MSRLRNAATVDVIPSAKRLVSSLRDIGYDFVHAVADLVDNSIAAGASEVKIDLNFGGTDSWVRIADNGSGMNGTAITEAMRYGSNRDYESEDLGKFGLGLKTASMSQCRRLTVASRIDQDVNRVEVRQLDLDYVEESDRWAVFIVPAADRSEDLVEPLSSGPGTVVMWEQLDRVMQYKIPWGERARNGLYKMAEQLDQHLGMVFHRFLAGEVPRRRRPLAIKVNGKRVEPWDPFARSEPHTEPLPEHEIDVQSPHGVGIVRFRPFVLPSQDRFSSPEMFQHMSGPAKWNQQQGLYIYRSNRMIQSGGWCWMRTSDEHTKFARAALDFYPDLDSAFEVNVAKVRVVLPVDLKEKLKPHVEQLVRRAQAVYRQSPGSAGGQHHHPRGARAHGVHRGSGASWSSESKGSNGFGEGGAGIDADPMVPPERMREALEAAARKVGENQAWGRMVDELRRRDPEVASAIGY